MIVCFVSVLNSADHEHELRVFDVSTCATLAVRRRCGIVMSAIVLRGEREPRDERATIAILLYGHVDGEKGVHRATLVDERVAARS